MSNKEEHHGYDMRVTDQDMQLNSDMMKMFTNMNNQIVADRTRGYTLKCQPSNIKERELLQLGREEE